MLLDALTKGARIAAACAFVYALLVALTHWAVRNGKLAPFGGLAKFIRRVSDPVLQPLERRMLRMGANPQEASVWLVGVSIGFGLILIALVDWLTGMIAETALYASQGALPRILVHYVFQILQLALMIRVLSSWVGLSPYSRFMRIVYGATSWLVEPIRRILPTMGMLDFSPLVAWFLLSFAESTLSRVLY